MPLYVWFPHVVLGLSVIAFGVSLRSYLRLTIAQLNEVFRLVQESQSQSGNP